MSSLFSSAFFTFRGFEQIARTDYPATLESFNKALEISPDLYTVLLARALCKSLLLEQLPNSEQKDFISEISSDLVNSLEFLKELSKKLG